MLCISKDYDYTHLKVELAVDRVALAVDQLEGMGAVPVHVTVAVWDPAITE